jgi:von Willebrand factor type A domain
MSVSFLTPAAAAVALGGLVPLAMLVLVSRRARSVRRSLELAQPRARPLLVALVALVCASSLVGLAAAQPVVEDKTRHRVRTDTELYFVVDTSRSMLAGRSPGSARRIERAKAAAIDVRASFPDVRVGIASLTDRVLPHLLPSPDVDVFAATLRRSIGIERPPPRVGLASRASSLAALTTVATQHFFSRAAHHRLLVVLTDGESLPVAGSGLATLFRRGPGIDPIFVQFWDEDERVFTGGSAEAGYRPDPTARAILESVASSTGGSVYSEDDLGGVKRKLRELIGEGPTIVEGEKSTRLALTPYIALAALLPFGLLMWRRER